jgi:branched-chain amino acid transport system substrate-binding protein
MISDNAIFRTLIFSSILSVMSACGASSANSDAVRIGVLYSLSGEQASLDESSLKGAELAAQEINAAGGILGKALLLEVRDAKTSPEAAAEGARELYGDEGLSIVMGLSDTGLANPVATESQLKEKLFVTSGATGPGLVKEAPTSTFLACFSDVTQARAAAQFARSVLTLRSIVVIRDETSEYARVLSDSFVSSFASAGRVVSRVSFQGSAVNLDSVVNQARANRADGIFLAAQPNEVATLLRALREGGIASPIIGGDSYDSPLIFALSADVKQGVYYTTHALLSGPAQSPGASAFIQNYTNSYGEAPESAFAALGYDTVRLIAQAVEKAGGTDVSLLRKALEDTSRFSGVTGSISYGIGKHIPQKDVSVVTFKDGVAVLASTVAGR